MAASGLPKKEDCDCICHVFGGKHIVACCTGGGFFDEDDQEREDPDA